MLSEYIYAIEPGSDEFNYVTFFIENKEQFNANNGQLSDESHPIYHIIEQYNIFELSEGYYEYVGSRSIHDIMHELNCEQDNRLIENYHVTYFI